MPPSGERRARTRGSGSDRRRSRLRRNSTGVPDRAPRCKTETDRRVPRQYQRYYAARRGRMYVPWPSYNSFRVTESVTTKDPLSRKRDRGSDLIGIGQAGLALWLEGLRLGTEKGVRAH